MPKFLIVADADKITGISIAHEGVSCARDLQTYTDDKEELARHLRDEGLAPGKYVAARGPERKMFGRTGPLTDDEIVTIRKILDSQIRDDLAAQIRRFQEILSYFPL